VVENEQIFLLLKMENLLLIIENFQPEKVNQTLLHLSKNSIGNFIDFRALQTLKNLKNFTDLENKEIKKLLEFKDAFVIKGNSFQLKEKFDYFFMKNELIQDLLNGQLFIEIHGIPKDFGAALIEPFYQKFGKIVHVEVLNSVKIQYENYKSYKTLLMSTPKFNDFTVQYSLKSHPSLLYSEPLKEILMPLKTRNKVLEFKLQLDNDILTTTKSLKVISS
jgi:hypothetical protein